MTLTDINTKLQDAKDSPHMLADLRMELSAEFTKRTVALNEVLLHKPAIWNTLREAAKSDVQAERHWQATPDGLQETTLKNELKALEKVMSAVRGLLEVFTAEARNLM
jgi:hypothetical protein